MRIALEPNMNNKALTVANIKAWQAQAQDNNDSIDHVGRSVAARLCEEILTTFHEVLRQICQRQDIAKPIYISLGRAYSCIALWSDGYGVKEGNLDDVLAKSRVVRRSTLKALSSVAETILDRVLFTPSRKQPIALANL